MSNNRGLRGLAETARQEVVAWYRGPNADALTDLSLADRTALINLGTIPIRVAIDAADTLLGTKLVGTPRFNSLLGQDTDSSRGTRWSALVNFNDTLDAERTQQRAGDVLCNGQQRASQALQVHIAALLLDPKVVLPEMAALYVPAYSLRAHLWLPSTAITMPRANGGDGVYYPLDSFPADEPQTQPAPYSLAHKTEA